MEIKEHKLQVNLELTHLKRRVQYRVCTKYRVCLRLSETRGTSGITRGITFE